MARPPHRGFRLILVKEGKSEGFPRRGVSDFFGKGPASVPDPFGNFLVGPLHRPRQRKRTKEARKVPKKIRVVPRKAKGFQKRGLSFSLWKPRELQKP